ncbi:TPA: HBL/NHE enterotoxin family protein [Bacillus toyonensis]|uniref:HBL/NHE enterotoxin family protein n=1 Tax=Bacillus cereus group TaxID=86661 RepID=UPI00321ABCF5|nr:HBL/NHE enterotoxin family protein [Bacillus toyonensis]
MKKLPIITGCVITAMMASQVLPLPACAAEKKQTENQSLNTSNILVSPTLQNLGTQSILLKTYALTLLKQPTVAIEAMPNLKSYQEKAKQHARDWLDTVQPSFIDANQQSISFQQKFQIYYDKLIELSSKISTDDQAKIDFVMGITKLQESLNKHQNQIEKMSLDLQKFQRNFNVDAENFMNAAAAATTSLANKNGEVEQLTKQIEAINGDIKSQIGIIVGGTIGMVAGIGAIVFGTIVLFTTTVATGGVGAAVVVPALGSIAPALGGIVGGTGGLIGGGVTVGFAAKKLEEKRKELQEITQKLTTTKADAAALTLLVGQVNAFKENVTKGKESLEGFDDNWFELKNNFTELQQYVNKINPDSSVLQNNLVQIKKRVDDLAAQAKQQEKVITDISYQ